MNRVYEHDLASVPIGWGIEGTGWDGDTVLIRKQLSYVQVSRELIEDAMPCGWLLGWRRRPWAQREREAIAANALRRRIPRVIRKAIYDARAAIARCIAPFEIGNDE